ncbi:hypothetical protein PYW08_002957 [Mythimna loreyi]|uniref:Uncharacterized protein n=1 Tax=Mythimna loreyi TaxID=667449 RepID=A0ACC2QJF0_9NEOP|nr:hypothetical protein PYW08_002957 [Mythimna loreyi]
MFKSGTKSGDYHDDMNFTNYEKWLKTKLIPNLNPNSVVIDHAPYHNNIAPTSSSKKDDMKSWLSEKGIPFDDHMLKPQLYQLICQNKSAHKNFVIDDILAQHNHNVLRLPPYHPDLNPIEMAWAAVKGYVATKNVDFNVNRTMELVKEKVDSMGRDEWVALCAKVKKNEEDYRSNEHIIDDMTENFVIFTGDSSDSELESENDSDSESDSDGETPTSMFQGDKRSFIEGVSAMSTDDSELI